MSYSYKAIIQMRVKESITNHFFEIISTRAFKYGQKKEAPKRIRRNITAVTQKSICLILNTALGMDQKHGWREIYT